MKKTKLVSIISLVLACMMILSSCVAKSGSDEIKTDKPTSEAKTTEAAEKKEPPVKFTMFYQEAGQNFPDGFKHNDNWFFNYMCEEANVEITELNVPAYADTATKFNLMMSSGEIPDLVERADPTTMKQYGMEGAFMPTLDIIKNSQVISSYYDDVQLEAMQSKDGVAYVIQIPPINDSYNTMWVRWDLLQKLGYTEVPETLDEWVDACRKLKEYDPNSIPLASRVDLGYAWITFVPFNVGASGTGWAYYPERGKVCNVWEGDNIINAVKFGKMLYDEGLWDKEFITTTSAEYGQKKLRNNVLIHYNDIGSLVIWLERFINDDQPDVRLIPVNMPMAEGAGVDRWYKTPSVLGSYTFGINAKTKALDGIVRFLEVLYSNEVKDMMDYGREGIEYKIDNNKRVPIFPAATESAWRSIYGWVFIDNIDWMNYGLEMLINSSPGMTDTEKADYIKLQLDADKKVRDRIYGHVGYNPMSLALPIEDNLLNLSSQASELQKSLIAKTIIGEMSMETFILEKEKLVKEFQDVTDAYNKNANEAKAKYKLD